MHAKISCYTVSIINSDLINRYVRCRHSDQLIARASALLQLIFIRDHSFNLSGWWDIQEINYVLSAICREGVVFVFHSSRLMFFFSLFHCIFCVLIFVYLSCMNKDNNKNGTTPQVVARFCLCIQIHNKRAFWTNRSKTEMTDHTSTKRPFLFIINECTDTRSIDSLLK